MKKKDYQQPSMQIVEVRPHAVILETSQGAGVKASREGYGEASSQNWNDSESAVKSYRNPVDWEE